MKEFSVQWCDIRANHKFPRVYVIFAVVMPGIGGHKFKLGSELWGKARPVELAKCRRVHCGFCISVIINIDACVT